MAKENLLFTKDHEWVRRAGDTVTVGITDYAQHELGDVVFVDLPAAGKELKKGDPAPISNRSRPFPTSTPRSPATITEVNAKLGDNPELVNQEPFGEGWLFKMSMSQACRARLS